MGQSIRAQALFLLLAAGLGVGLGLLYDLLRPLRRRTGDALWDLLFCAAAALGGFCFAMRSDSGRLGSGELAAALAAFWLYARLLSPAVAPLSENFFCFPGRIRVKIAKRSKMKHNHEKKLFQSAGE